MASKDHSADGIVAQMLIATGQGMGSVRIAQSAVQALEARYRKSVSKEMIDDWIDMGTHVLEKNRAVGRHMASKLAESGATVIDEQLALGSFRAVAWRKKSRYCNREGGEG